MEVNAEPLDRKMQRQFKNWQYRTGTERQSNPVRWDMPYSETVAMEQALDTRSQYEWFTQFERVT